VATKHDTYVEQLCQDLSVHYDSLETHVPLWKGRKAKRKRLVAEIDIIAYRDEEVHIYEVKCSHRISKARRQLLKISRIVRGVSKMFFFCGESGNLILLTLQEERVITIEELAEL
jgi:hypothetical protein